MPKSLLFILASALLILPTLSSCRKVYDFIRDHPDARDTLCRVTQIRLNGFYSNRPDTFDVSYNAKGDPTDMVQRPAPIHVIENTDQHWRYDKYGRLILYYIIFTQAANAPPISGALFWHKYDYPRKNFVTDTLIQYAEGFPPNFKDAGGTITGYGLDDKGKITKIYSVSPDPHQPPQLVTDVAYDANGNLPITNPSFAYDNMVNIYRTSYTFQFVYNDFSRNNQIEAGITPIHGLPTYNQFGLPVTIPYLGQFYNTPFGLATSGPLIYFDYACSAPHGPVNY